MYVFCFASVRICRAPASTPVSRRAGRHCFGGNNPCRVHNASVRGYVGVTGNDWYHFLADRPDLSEVNFWRPRGGRGFHVLSVGEPFFFKTHPLPHNRAVGG
jgi:hypothetical protein